MDTNDNINGNMEVKPEEINPTVIVTLSDGSTMEMGREQAKIYEHTIRNNPQPSDLTTSVGLEPVTVEVIPEVKESAPAPIVAPVESKQESITISHAVPSPGVVIEKVVENVVPVVSAVPVEKSKPIYFCTMCRESWNDQQVNKQPLDFIRNEDGTLTHEFTRYSIFCKKCSQFLMIVDPVAADELKKMETAPNPFKGQK